MNKIVFLGTPEFALPSLKMLINEGYDIAAVFTQPDRPKGRGHKMLPPPVKVMAQEAGIPVYQFEKISRDGVETLREIAPDLMITAAFGQILSRELLAIPPLGCINVHASLLPKYRGAAPIEQAIINGEKQAGVTTMYTVYELDAGDMLEHDAIDVSPEMTGGELREKLSHVGAEVLRRTLEKLKEGTLIRTPQDGSQMTYYPMFPRGYGHIDFSQEPNKIVDMVRALDPDMGAYAFDGEDKIKIWKAAISDAAACDCAPGAVICADQKNGLTVAAGGGAVGILELQAPGSRRMSAKDYLRGHTIGDLH